MSYPTFAAASRPGRVGIVCPYSFHRPGGVQNHVLGLAGWLKQCGYHVGILAPGVPAQGMLAGYGLASEDFTTGGRAVPIKANGSVARINFGFDSLRRAKCWLDKGDFDVVHLHEPITPTLSLQTLWLTDRPVTATFHTASPISKTLQVANRLLPQVVGRIDASIAVSSEAARVAHAHSGVVPVVIGNGLTVSDYQLTPTTGRWRGGQMPRITFLGRYGEPRKGFQVLTAALPLIREVYPDVDVVVIGHGTKMSIEGVRFVGGVNDAQRNAWLAASDVYIAPQTGRESFGIVLIEALACGAPVAASNLPAFIDVLSDAEGVAGHLFQAGNSSALARAVLDSLVEPRDLNLSRGRKVAERYDWSQIGPQIVEMYRISGENRYMNVEQPKGRVRHGSPLPSLGLD